MNSNLPSASPTRLDFQSVLSSLPRLVLNTNIKLSPTRILAKPAFIFVLAFLLLELLRYFLSTLLLLVLRSRAPKSSFKTSLLFAYTSLLTAAIITASINTVRSFRQYLSDDSLLTKYPIVSRTLNLFLKDVRGTYTISYTVIIIMFCFSIPIVYSLDTTRKAMSLVGKAYVLLMIIALASIRTAVYAESEDLPLYIPERISLNLSRTLLFVSVLISLLSVLLSLIIGGLQKTYPYRLVALLLQLTAVALVVAVAADSAIGGLETARRLEQMFLNKSFDVGTVIPTTARMDLAKQVSEVLESVLAQVIITTITDLFFCLVVVATAATLARFYLTARKDDKVSYEDEQQEDSIDDTNVMSNDFVADHSFIT